MKKKCLGCGAILQNTNENEIGYVPDLEMDYCQRCFRMNHYGSQTVVNIAAMHNIDFLQENDADYLWLIDVTDLESSFDSSFVDFFRNHNCSIVLTKCDLLPATLSEKKLITYIEERLKQLGIKTNNIFVKGTNSSFLSFFEQRMTSNVKNLMLVGVSNVGKSTLINQLLSENRITVNPHPSTTLSLNYVDTRFGTVIDSVGLVVEDGIQMYLKDDDLNKVINNKPLKPKVYQLEGNQSIAIGGLARIDLFDCQNLTAVVYVSNFIKCLRSKQENADQLWLNHLGEQLIPTISNDIEDLDYREFILPYEKSDIYIKGIGWVCVSGKCKGVKVYKDKRISVGIRKAMI